MRFEQARFPRTARTQLISREMCQIYHPAGPAAWRRNELLGGLTADDMYDRVAWLHGGG
jgi:salicylate hydroxylase